MDNTTALVTIVVAIIGGLGGFSAFIKMVLDYKIQKKKEAQEQPLTPIIRDVSLLREESKEQAIAISRTQLLILMNHYPKDHQAILSELEHYIKMGGNSWMVDLATSWAEKENINIDYILTFHKGDKK